MHTQAIEQMIETISLAVITAGGTYITNHLKNNNKQRTEYEKQDIHAKCLNPENKSIARNIVEAQLEDINRTYESMYTSLQKISIILNSCY